MDWFLAASSSAETAGEWLKRPTDVASDMFRAILPDGDIGCATYEEGERGVELYTEDDELIAFVPYANLIALVNEDVDRGTERSVM